MNNDSQLPIYQAEPRMLSNEPDGNMGAAPRIPLRDASTVLMEKMQQQLSELQAQVIELRAAAVDSATTRSGVPDPARAQWPKLLRLEDVQTWLQNFEMRCNFYRFGDAQRVSHALNLVGEPIMRELFTRLPLLRDPNRACEITWPQMRTALLGACSGAHPMIYAQRYHGGITKALLKKNIPLNECWPQLIAAQEQLSSTIVQYFGTHWPKEVADEFTRVLRLAMLPGLLLDLVKVPLASLGDPFLKDPEALYAEVRAAVQHSASSSGSVDPLSRGKRVREEDTEDVAMLAMEDVKCFFCGIKGHLAKDCRKKKAAAAGNNQQHQSEIAHGGDRDSSLSLQIEGTGDDVAGKPVRRPTLVAVRMVVSRNRQFSENRFKRVDSSDNLPSTNCENLDMSTETLDLDENFSDAVPGPLEKFCNFENNFEVKVLLDSCSTKSFIKPEIVSILGLAKFLDKSEYFIKGATSGVQRTRGGVTVRLTAINTVGKPEGCTVYLNSYDFPGGDILLGTDMLSAHKFVLNFRHFTVKCARNLILPMEVQWVEESAPCSLETLLAVEKSEVKAFSQVLVQVQAPKLQENNFCFSAFVFPAEEAARNGILCAKGYPDFHGGLSEVLVVNATPNSVKIAPGDTVGFVSLKQADDLVDIMEPQEDVCLVSEDFSKKISNQPIPSNLDLTSAKNILTRTEFNKLIQLLRGLSNVWRKPDEKLGAGVSFRHAVDTGSSRPVNEKPRRLQPRKMTEALAEVERMQSLNVIEPTNSPWAAPIVLVTKKDGSTRFCVDYRRLNDVTKADVYPLPRCDDLLNSLDGKRYFSALDLESGYWQIPMSEQDKQKTAFVTPFGAWQFKNMPFGLRNAPSTFQRTMDMVLSGAKWNHCLVYIDDILIFSETVDDHLQHIADVFGRLIKFNLKLKPSKCELFKPELVFLGHLISEKGIKPNPKKTAAIMNWPEPTRLTEVESFLGLCSYYRKFIRNFSLIAAPLYALKAGWSWGDSQRDTFALLKSKLASPPVLKHPRANEPFIIEVDASGLGLGAVLLQSHEGVEQPIEFASRLLRKHEKNYPVRELEALGILWACELFRHWLLQQTFMIRTDHKSLEVLHKVKGGRLERWLMRLAPFHFELAYKKGKANVVPDRLSRSSVDACPELVDSESLTDEMTLLTAATKVRINDIVEHQTSDCEFRKIREYLLTGIVPKHAIGKHARFVANAKQYQLRNGVLYRENAIVLPSALRSAVIDELHSAAHFGAEKILPGIRQRFWWHGLARDVKSFCRACVSCARATPFNSGRLGQLKPIESEGPWHTVAMDLAGPFPLGDENERFVLVIMDHFTKYVILIALRSKRASLIARKVHKRLLSFVGCPRTIITDNGTEFKAEFDALCTENSIHHACVLPYHQQANGLVERYMQSLNKMVRIIAEERRECWATALCAHAFAYNASFHRAVLNTPYFLNFGRDPYIPIDNRLSQSTDVRLREFSKTKALNTAHLMLWTANRLREYQSQMKADFDRHQKHLSVQLGDVVFIRNEGLLSKAAMRWSEAHRVVGIHTSGLEITVKPLYGNGTEQTVSVKRIRPYNPSTLNPLVPHSVPLQELTQPPTVDEPTHLDAVDSVYLPNISCTNEDDIVRSRWTTGVRNSHFVDKPTERSVTCGVENSFPLEDEGSCVRNSHANTDSFKEFLSPPLNDEVVDSASSETPLVTETHESLPEAEDVLHDTTRRDVIVSEVDTSMAVQGATKGDNRCSEVSEPIVFTQGANTNQTTDTVLVDPEFEIDSLVAHRTVRGYRHYKVRWAGYGPESDTWEPGWQLPHASVQEYEHTLLPGAGSSSTPHTISKSRSRR